MPSLKDLRNRINSVKSTRKITSAMKMVSAAKLRRAQEQAEAGRPYAERMGRMLAALSANVSQGPRLMTGTGKDDTILLIAITSDRGLCAGFNSGVARETRREVTRLQAKGKTVKIITVGRKGKDMLVRTNASQVIAIYEDIFRESTTFTAVMRLTDDVIARYEAGESDIALVVYNRFRSAISQVVEARPLLPFRPTPMLGEAPKTQDHGPKAAYEFERHEDEILRELLPRNVAVQLYDMLLESVAGEHGARMTAMDNATRNAGEMIKSLTLNYNRRRQASITTELTEIVSGAEALK